jgi:hypothetical protein
MILQGYKMFYGTLCNSFLCLLLKLISKEMTKNRKRIAKHWGGSVQTEDDSKAKHVT